MSYVANDSTASLLFHNNHDGTFTERGLQAGVALTADGRAQAGMGLAAADYDHDGWLDIVKTNFDDDTPSLYRNLGDGTFEDASLRSGLGVNTRYLGWGVGFVDVDLDGWRDILIVNGHVYPEADRVGGRYSYEQRRLLYRNLGNGRFEDVSGRAGPGLLEQRASRGAAVGDLFNTGTEDVVVSNMHNAPSLLHNCAPTRDTAWWCSWSGRARTGVPSAPASRCRRPPTTDRRSAQRRKLRCPERSAGRSSDSATGPAPTGWRSPGPAARPRRWRGIDADQLVVIREGSGVVRRQPLARGTTTACAGR